VNKRVNTILFILGATLFNIIVTVTAFLALLTAYARLLMRRLPDSVDAWFVPLLFIAAIAVSFVVYRFSFNLLLDKIDMDKYFDPVFKSRRSSP